MPNYEKIFNASFSFAIKVEMRNLAAAIQDELVAQGHVNTGRLRDSIKEGVEVITLGLRAYIQAQDYWEVVNGGVPARNIPFSGVSGSGGFSQYIEGLKSFFEDKGLDSKEALGAAFGTAFEHLREGMPTRASRRFSSNGKRTGFATDTIEASGDILERMLTAGEKEYADRIVKELLRENEARVERANIKLF